MVWWASGAGARLWGRSARAAREGAPTLPSASATAQRPGRLTRLFRLLSRRSSCIARSEVTVLPELSPVVPPDSVHPEALQAANTPLSLLGRDDGTDELPLPGEASGGVEVASYGPGAVELQVHATERLSPVSLAASSSSSRSAEGSTAGEDGRPGPAEAQKIAGVRPPVCHDLGVPLLARWLAGRHSRAEHVGSGSRGDVYLLHGTGIGKPGSAKLLRALRTADRRGPETQEDLLYEACILRKLCHRNIAYLHEVAHTNEHLLILTESAGRQNLSSLLQASGPAFPAARTRTLFHQVASALAHCHKCDVVHRNLTPEAVDVSTDGLTVTISDFRWADDASVPCERVGRVPFVAPEVMALEELWYNAKSADIWSAGVCFLSMLCGADFFPNLFGWQGSEPASSKLSDDVRNFLLSPERLTQAVEQRVPVGSDLDQLLQGMLHIFVRRRWTADMVVASAWLAGGAAHS